MLGLTLFPRTGKSKSGGGGGLEFLDEVGPYLKQAETAPS